jgi:hypothetical protein
MIGLGWLTKKAPLSTSQLLKNTDHKRIQRANTEIRIASYNYHFVIKKLPLGKRILSFFTKSPVNVVFVRIMVYTKNIKNGNNHWVILELPYVKNMTSTNIADLPIKVYSDTMDLKFRFAWELHQTKKLFVDEDLKRKLGIALTQRPVDVTPLGSKQFDKHLYHVITNIHRLTIT